MYIYIYIHAFFAHTISSIFTASSFTVCQPNENSSLRQVNCTVDRKILFSHYFSRTRKFTLFFEACSVFRRKKGDDQRLINIRLTIRSSIHQVESKVWYRGALLVKFWQKKKKIDSTIQTVVQSCAGKLESYTGRFSFSSVYNTPPRSYRCSWSISHPVRTGQRF